MTEQEISKSTVSVVIPTYYRNDLLESTLRSVLAQEYSPIEIIVVDDSGESYAKPIMDKFEEVVYVPKDKNQGPQVARTTGIKKSTGGYIQLLDDDDRLHDTKIQQQVELLKANPDVGVAYCGFSWNDETDVLPKRHVRGNVLKNTLIFDTAPCITSTMLIERSILEQCLPLADRSGADDTGLKIELALLTEFDYIDEALVSRMDSPDSRQSSSGKVRGQRQIINEYQHLYGQFPRSVYQTAVAETYLIEGLHELDEQLWSLKSIILLGKACVAMPRFSLPMFGAFIVCLFGQPGRDLGLQVLQFIRGRDRRGKSL